MTLPLKFDSEYLTIKDRKGLESAVLSNCTSNKIWLSLKNIMYDKNSKFNNTITLKFLEGYNYNDLLPPSKNIARFLTELALYVYGFIKFELVDQVMIIYLDNKEVYIDYTDWQTYGHDDIIKEAKYTDSELKELEVIRKI